MPSERTFAIGLLDAFQAAERAGADALDRWIPACHDARLRGGLRVICARGRRHAALAEERLRALGGEPAAVVSPELAGLCALVSDPGIPDRAKLAMLVARFPGREVSPLGGALQQVEDDPETRALLQTIEDDELVGLRWLREMSNRLAGETP